MRQLHPADGIDVARVVPNAPVKNAFITAQVLVDRATRDLVRKTRSLMTAERRAGGFLDNQAIEPGAQALGRDER